MRTCLCNTRASSYPDDDGLARNGTEILLNRSRSVHFCSANGQILGVEWQNDESSSSRIRVSAAACGPAMWLRATLPGLTGQTDPHGQLTADEMGILPSTYGVPFTGGSSLRGHAIGGERYVAPFGGGGPGAASAAVATEGGAAWLEAGNTAFRARRRRRQGSPPAQFTVIPSASERFICRSNRIPWSQRGGWAAGACPPPIRPVLP